MLFNATTQENAAISDMVCFIGGNCQWRFQDEFVGQNMDVQELLVLCDILVQVRPDGDPDDDSFRWFVNSEGNNVVSERYKAMAKGGGR